MALRLTKQLLNVDHKHHSRLYHYFRVANHQQGSSLNTWEVYDQTGGYKYVVNLKVPSSSNNVATGSQPAMVHWHGFKMTHPSVVNQFMDLTDCVLCGSCTAACPSTGGTTTSSLDLRLWCRPGVGCGSSTTTWRHSRRR
eukprot:TRINITY_DN2389_c0_g1_i1.p1 TRINITY_DN2389_c0_g1~~TRINITY_DN2389_c0_g1_i1.p1  ORF type:complete len:140 (+),score=17.14 TRINITY_DN2389_c0_g1_i1:18-437(+)